MDETKKGIALFITLLIIASILSIVAVSFSYLEKAQDDAGKTSALIQANLLYKNTTNILKRIFPKGKTDSKKLDILYTVPMMLSDEESGFSLSLQCQPLMVGVPIKWLDETFTEKIPERNALAHKILGYIYDAYEIDEPSALEQKILSEITGIKEYNSDFEPRIKPNRGIVSKQQFDKVLLEYRLEFDDINVYKVPWEKYFVFIDVTDKALVDGEYLSAELIAAAFEIPLQTVQDTWFIDLELDQKPTLKTYLEENGALEPFNKKLFSEKGLNAMHCEETYAYRDRYYRFSFDYENERNANFEFHGKL